MEARTLKFGSVVISRAYWYESPIAMPISKKLALGSRSSESSINLMRPSWSFGQEDPRWVMVTSTRESKVGWDGWHTKANQQSTDEKYDQPFRDCDKASCFSTHVFGFCHDVGEHHEPPKISWYKKHSNPDPSPEDCELPLWSWRCTS